MWVSAMTYTPKKLSAGVHLRSKRTNYSAQVFKTYTMQSVHKWKGLFDVPAIFVFLYNFNLPSDRGFKCRLPNVVNISVVSLFRHNFKLMFLCKSTQNTQKSILQCVKAVYSFLFLESNFNLLLIYCHILTWPLSRQVQINM